MVSPPLLVSLPIADRRRSHDFYRQWLDVDAVGEPGEDGIAEPLQFPLADGLHLMLVPRGGFGWVLDGGPVAESGQHEVLLSTTAATTDEVHDAVARAAGLGGQVLVSAGPQPWGYVGVVADPDGHAWMVTVADE